MGKVFDLSIIYIKRIEICPRNSNTTDEINRGVYANIHDNIHRLWDVGLNLNDVKLPRHITSETMFLNSGKWHANCRRNYSDSRVERMINTHNRNKEATETDNAGPARKRTRLVFNDSLCIFCQKNSDENLHLVTTLEFGVSYSLMSSEMNDDDVNVRFVTGDAVANNAKYHETCRTKYNNKYKSFLQNQTPTSVRESQILYKRAFIEIVNFIQGEKETGETLFPLANLFRQFNERREQLGSDTLANRTVFKNRVLEAFQGDLREEVPENGPKTLIFGDGVKTIINDVLKKRKYSSEMKIFEESVKVVREDIFNHKSEMFSGSFEEGCQSDAVPASLRTLVSMLIHGTSLRDQEAKESQVVHSIAQLIHFNAKKSSRGRDVIWHFKEREPPMPIYLSLMIHRETRSQKIIDLLFHMG